MKITAMGWAVITDDNIEVRTVCPTKRGAMVNWLVTHGTLVLSSHTDKNIEDMWEAERIRRDNHMRLSQRRPCIWQLPLHLPLRS